MIHYPPLSNQDTLYRMFVQGTESPDSPVMSFFLWPVRVLVLTLSYSVEIILNRRPGERYYRFLSFFLGALLTNQILWCMVFFPQLAEAEVPLLDRFLYIFFPFDIPPEIAENLDSSIVMMVPVFTFLVGVIQHFFRRYNRIMLSNNPIHSQSPGKSRFWNWTKRWMKDDYQHQLFIAYADPFLVLFFALIALGTEPSKEWHYVPQYFIACAACLAFRRFIAISYERFQRLNLYDAQLQNIPTLKAYHRKQGLFQHEHIARKA